jgi:hypothetical protein
VSDLIERAKAAQEGATPGPWIIRTLENFGFNVVNYINGDKHNLKRIAKVGDVATARLIALASDLARALIDTTAERDALRERVARLEAALELYSCEDGCNDCPEHERDRVSCGWTALTALQEDTPNDL